MPCADTIGLIHEAGGVAILAHPGIDADISRAVPRLMALPFDGIEVYHTKHTPGHVTHFTQIAIERDLLISGGSDCHGAAKGEAPEMGKVRVPYYHYERIVAATKSAGD